MAANPKPVHNLNDKRATEGSRKEESDGKTDLCDAKIDPNAPAGSRNSLGAKSDCNGRPDTDDSVVEAMDEQGPLTNSGSGNRQ
jgi:hypothetical protein